MGAFDFKPQADEKYKVIVRYKQHNYDFDLPTIQPEGYVMHLNQHDEILDVEIQQSADIENELLGLTITCRGKLCYFDSLRVEKNQTLHIETDSLPTGVNTLTLFSATGEVMSERLFFVRRPSAVSLICTPDKTIYKPLEKISLAIASKDRNERSVAGTVSVSVRDAGNSSVDVQGENIYTNLLLSSELKGHIERPAYYFEADDSLHRHHLDLLLLTQGWRRYVWKQMAGIEPLLTPHPIEESLMIKGQVLHPFNNKPIPYTRLSFYMNKDSAGISDMGVTDAFGCFAFVGSRFDVFGEWDLLLQTFEQGKAVKSRITLDRQFSPKGKAYGFYDTFFNDKRLKFNDTLPEAKVSLSDVHVLQELKVKSRRTPEPKPDIVYNVDKEIEALADRGVPYPTTLGDYLERKDSRFEIFSKEGTGLVLRYENIPIITVYNNNYYIKLRSINQSLLNLFYGNTEHFKIITLYKNPYYWQGRINPRNDRPISANAKMISLQIEVKTDMRVFNLNPNARITHFYGYSYSKEFAKTVIPEPVAGDIDHRRTLYWNPDVRIDETGRTDINFYNNSVGNHIIVNIEGMTNKSEIIEYQSYKD
ncbi:MAG: hypothetical protein LBR66_03085 [Candidatus Symbiothrix sp.]|jgi:hypothetical protein|nr:hypothetical protein [Candidatus Symbiothrix sp.]